MKFLLLFLLTAAMAFGAEEPTVEVYSITKYDPNAIWPDLPEDKKEPETLTPKDYTSDE